jgi:hypothetical protein
MMRLWYRWIGECGQEDWGVLVGLTLAGWGEEGLARGGGGGGLSSLFRGNSCTAMLKLYGKKTEFTFQRY